MDEVGDVVNAENRSHLWENMLLGFRGVSQAVAEALCIDSI